jgi:hypothetical protein
VDSLEAAFPQELFAPAVPQRLLGQHEDSRIARQRKPSQRAPGAAPDHYVIARFVSGDAKAVHEWFVSCQWCQWSVETFGYQLSAISNNPRTKADLQGLVPVASFIRESGLVLTDGLRTENRPFEPLTTDQGQLTKDKS